MKGSALAAFFLMEMAPVRIWVEAGGVGHLQSGPVVQRPSIRPCQGRDRRFESGRDRSIELINANSGATEGFGRTLILPSRIRMTSKIDPTDQRLMIRPSRIATLNWRFRRGRRTVVAADGALA